VQVLFGIEAVEARRRRICFILTGGMGTTSMRNFCDIEGPIIVRFSMVQTRLFWGYS